MARTKREPARTADGHVVVTWSDRAWLPHVEPGVDGSFQHAMRADVKNRTLCGKPTDGWWSESDESDAVPVNCRTCLRAMGRVQRARREMLGDADAPGPFHPFGNPYPVPKDR